ncbi:hypothetical protein [Leisingera caerulea]|uniref:hypothetical protein n=1 Tax=Leisingera caerulea TaxID=506591 RepID=UPI0003FBC5E7|nr:hypothetical protein [Leisingera caerulea]
MPLAEKLTADDWQHDAGADRVENIAVYDPKISEALPRLALRFISEKGLSEEFADVLEEIQSIEAESNDPAP